MIALQAPVATDLRAVISAIKIIADVERSADLCVNICKAARRIYGHELDPHLRGVIQKMGDQAQVLFKEATEAYLNLDGVRAAALHDMDAYLDDLHRQFIQVIFESHATGNIDLQVAVQLAVVARFYERIGDHAVNVGDRTRYIVNGWLPERPYSESDNDPPDVVRLPTPTATEHDHRRRGRPRARDRRGLRRFPLGQPTPRPTARHPGERRTRSERKRRGGVFG